MDGCPGWSDSSLGTHAILLVLSCVGSSRLPAMTCFPRPLPSFAPSIIPGKSNNCKKKGKQMLVLSFLLCKISYESYTGSTIIYVYYPGPISWQLPWHIFVADSSYMPLLLQSCYDKIFFCERKTDTDFKFLNTRGDQKVRGKVL